MRHSSNQTLSNLSSIIPGISCEGSQKDLCDVCLGAKHTRYPFGIKENKALLHSDLVRYDIWGYYYVKSFCGGSYFLTILDDASICVWVYLMRKKAKASQLVKNFCVMVQIQFKTRVQTIRSHNSTKFTGLMKKKKL